jgi:hypothetical protein
MFDVPDRQPCRDLHHLAATGDASTFACPEEEERRHAIEPTPVGPDHVYAPP